MAYRYSRQIKIDHTFVAADLTDFPVLISGRYPFLKTTGNGGRLSSSSGFDITFYADAAFAQELDHEIESYDPATGSIVAWVRVPELSSTADTVIYVVYGDASIATDQSHPHDVWDSNYKAVLHCVTGADSTSNGNDATAQNGATFGASSKTVIEHVQSAVGNLVGAGTTSIKIQPQHVGNFLIVASTGNGSTVSISDDHGHDWTVIVPVELGAGDGVKLSYTRANTTTEEITVTLSSNGSYCSLMCDEFSGVHPTDPIDVTAFQTGNGAYTLPSETVNFDDCLLYSTIAIDVNHHTASPGSSFTLGSVDHANTNGGDICEFKVLEGGAGTSQTCTYVGSGPYIGAWAAIKPDPSVQSTDPGLSLTKQDAPYQYAEVAGTLGSPSEITLEAWSKVTEIGATGGTLIDIANNIGIQFSTADPRGTWAYCATGPGAYISYEDTSADRVNDRQTHYYVLTAKDGGIVLYIDGTAVVTQGGSGAPYYDTGNGGLSAIRIGADAVSSPDGFVTSELTDEIRFSSVVRSAAWIQTTYASLNSPSTFYGVGDESAVSNNYSKSFSEVFTISDALTRGIGKHWSDSTAITDSIKKSTSHSVADRFPLIDSISKATDKSLRDSFSITDAFARSMALVRNFADSFSIIDVFSRRADYKRPFADKFTLRETFMRGLARVLNLADQFEIVDSIQKGIGRVHHDAFVLSESIQRSTNKSWHETFTLTDSLRRGTSKAFTDSFTIVESIGKAISKSLSDAFSLIDWLGLKAQKGIQLAFHDVFALSDSLRKSVGKSLSDRFNLIEWIGTQRRTIRIIAAELWRRLWRNQSMDRAWAAENHKRKFKANKDEYMITEISKPAGSSEDFAIDWSTISESDPITSSEWTVGTGLENVQDSHTQTTATIRLSGGTIGKRVLVENSVTLASGQVKVQALQITIIN